MMAIIKKFKANFYIKFEFEGGYLRRKTIFTILLFMIVGQLSKAVDKKDYPEIGKPCPEFLLRRVHNSENETLKLSDLKGQYFILDFWSTSCGVCIASFPKLNEIQRKFGSRLKIILVGLEEKRSDIEKAYKHYEEKFDLRLISAFDSVLFQRFVPTGVPHLLWVNKEGIVTAITTSADVNENSVEKFLNDSIFTFEDQSYSGIMKQKLQVDLSKPLLIDGNGGDDKNYLFRSVLSAWKPGMGEGYYTEIDFFLQAFKSGRYQVTKANVDILVYLAYIGTLDLLSVGVYPKLIWGSQGKPPTELKSLGNKSRLYNYSIEVPIERANRRTIMSAMQNDLKVCFGLTAEIKTRQVECLKIVVIDKIKATKLFDSKVSFQRVWTVGSRKVRLPSVTLDTFAGMLTKSLGSSLSDKPLIVNSTDIKDNVSLNFAAQIDDLQSLRRGLRKYGLDLIYGNILMKVLEIISVE